MPPQAWSGLVRHWSACTGRQRLDPSTRRGPGRAKEALASTAQTPGQAGPGSRDPSARAVRARGRSRRGRARRRRVRRAHVVPGDAERLLARLPRGPTRRRRRAPSRGPSGPARTGGRSTPAPARAAWAVRRSGVRPRRAGRAATPTNARPVPRCRWLAQRGDGREHLVEGVRVDGEHVGAAAEVREGVVDDRDVDGAHRAQVLGDDEVGVQSGQRALVEVVEVLARRASRRPRVVDLAGVSPSGIAWSTRSAGLRASRG